MRLNPLTETITSVKPTKYSRDSWEVVECSETGMVFLANPPDYSQMVDEFAWEKTYQEEKKRRRETEPVVTLVSDGVKSVRMALKKRDRITKLALTVAADMRPGEGSDALALVDVGCGEAGPTAEVVRHFASRGVTIRPTGIEISKALAAEAGAKLASFDGRCIHAPGLGGLEQVEDNSIDLVLLRSYLEHEIQPLKVLKECRRILTDQGRIIAKMPNFACWNRLVRQRKWCGFRYPDHVNYFTPDTLRAIIEKSGLRVIRMNLLDRFPTNDSMYVVAGK